VADRPGLPHLYEHFPWISGPKGKSPQEYRDEFDHATLRQWDAGTDSDSIAVWAMVANHNHDLALSLLLDPIVNPYWNRQHFAQERRIVIKEVVGARDLYRERAVDLFEALIHGRSQADHVRGNVAQVGEMTMEMVQDLHREVAQTGNLTLTAVGSGLRGLESRFRKKLEGLKESPRVVPRPIDLTRKGQRIETVPSNAVYFVGGVVLPDALDRLHLIECLEIIMGREGASLGGTLLAESNRESGLLAYDLEIKRGTIGTHAYLGVEANVSPSQAKLIKPMLDATYYNLASKITPRDLELALQIMQEEAEELAGDPWELAQKIGDMVAMEQPIVLPHQYFQLIETITVEQIRALAQEVEAVYRKQSLLAVLGPVDEKLDQVRFGRVKK
jgi:predicted Zn-dependent peptidase